VSVADDDEFRLEVDFQDEGHGERVGERLAQLHLDDEARERLAGHAVVTRDGSHVFVYTATEAEARTAEDVVRGLADEDGLTATYAVTRWHEVEQAWKDASMPLPRTDAEEEAAVERREQAEEREAEEEGSYDWRVVAHLPSRGAAKELAERLRAEGVPVTQRWRYVLADALTQERAAELEDRIQADAPDDTETSIEPNLSDVPGGWRFLFLQM
jgi:hypothetical protein